MTTSRWMRRRASGMAKNATKAASGQAVKKSLQPQKHEVGAKADIEKRHQKLTMKTMIPVTMTGKMILLLPSMRALPRGMSAQRAIAIKPLTTW